LGARGRDAGAVRDDRGRLYLFISFLANFFVIYRIILCI
jgi:hypothetical protein